MADLNELADRVEALNDCDGRIDLEVHLAATPQCLHENIVADIDDDGMGSSPMCIDCGQKPAFRSFSPLYTSSIDAALSLLVHGWEVMTAWDHGERTAQAAVGPNAIAGFILGEGKARGLDANDALARAITAAILRARAEGGA